MRVGLRTCTCCPKKGLAQGSLNAGRPAHTYLLPQKGAIQGSSRTRRPEDTYLLPQKGACWRPWMQGGLLTPACSSAPAGPARLPPRPAGPGKVPVHVRALVLLGLHGVEELQELSHVGLGNLRLHPAVRQVREARVADHVARVARDHEAAGVPLVRGQGQLRREALGLHQRLVVDHDELALVRPAVPLQEDPRALVAQQPQLRAAVGGRAVVGHLQLAPARPVLRQEEIVREVGGVGHGERVGGEELRRGDRARARRVAADHAGRTGDGQRGARERPGGCEARRRRCARGRQRARGHVARRGEVAGVGRVVDGECAAGDSCGGAQQAHAGRAADAQRAA